MICFICSRLVHKSFSDLSADDSTKGNNDADWLLGNGDDATVEQILVSIQSVQDRVCSLRSDLKKAMAKKSKGLLLKVNTQVNGAQSSNCSHGKGKVTEMPEISPQDASDCDMGDTDMPDSAVSSYGEANNMDIFESTMNLLSVEDPDKIGELRQVSYHNSFISRHNKLIRPPIWRSLSSNLYHPTPSRAKTLHNNVSG